MNDVNEMIKQAYAYGASVALQEVGYAPAQAEAAAVQLTLEKTAAEEDEEGMSPAMMALLGGGAGAVLGAGGGALAGKLTDKNLLRTLVDAPGRIGKRLRGATPAPTPIADAFAQRGSRSGGQLLSSSTGPVGPTPPPAGVPYPARGPHAPGAREMEPGKLQQILETITGKAKAAPGQAQEALQEMYRKGIMPQGFLSSGSAGAGLPNIGGSAAAGGGLGALLGAGGGGLYGALGEE